jgi:transcriptional regulator with XRE-family HTH domain
MKLEEARLRRYLSMAKLAQLSGVSLSTIRDAEAGRHAPSLGTCRRLAEALEIDPDEIDECREAKERQLS